LARFGEKEGAIEIQIYSVWRGYTSDLTLRLHLVTCSVPIYLSRKFQGIWRSPSSGPNYWALTGFRRAQLHLRIQHLEEHLLAFRPETSGGGSTHPDLSFYRFGVIWRLPSARPKYWVFSALQEDVPSARGFGLDPGSSCIGLHLVFSLWRLASSYREHFVAAHILSIGSI
jgi:hypothetical protein